MIVSSMSSQIVNWPLTQVRSSSISSTAAKKKRLLVLLQLFQGGRLEPRKVPRRRVGFQQRTSLARLRFAS